MTEITRYLPATNRDHAIASIAKLLVDVLPGKFLAITIGPKKRARSTLQNKALWGCAYPALRKQMGADVNDLHEFFCGEYFGWVEYEIMGRIKLKPFRTTTRDDQGNHDVISTVEMSDFYAAIQRKAAENGFDAPDPDPNWWQETEVKAA